MIYVFENIAQKQVHNSSGYQHELDFRQRYVKLFLNVFIVLVKECRSHKILRQSHQREHICDVADQKYL